MRRNKRQLKCVLSEMKACGPQKQWEDSPKTPASGHHPHDMHTCMCWHVQHTCIHMCRLQLSLEISPCLQFAQYFYCNLLMGTPKGPNYHDCKLKNECKCKIKRGEERQILIFLSGKNSWVEDKTATSPLQSTLENRFSHDFRGPHNLSFTSTLCTQQAPSYAC